MQELHIYVREDGGSLTRKDGLAEDLGGLREVTGPVIPLEGWPSPAMRQAVAGNGEIMSWYIGTDLDGAIKPAIKIIESKTARQIAARLSQDS